MIKDAADIKPILITEILLIELIKTIMNIIVGNGSIEGWLVIEGNVGQQILQADNRASAAR